MKTHEQVSEHAGVGLSGSHEVLKLLPLIGTVILSPFDRFQRYLSLKMFLNIYLSYKVDFIEKVK